MNGKGRGKIKPGPPWHLLEGTEENNKSQTEYLVSGARSEAKVSRIRCTNYSTTTFSEQPYYVRTGSHAVTMKITVFRRRSVRFTLTELSEKRCLHLQCTFSILCIK
jgi:hypothetical protein